MKKKMKTKSLIEIWAQMDRIRSYFPEWVSNEEFEGSWLKKAYEIVDKYVKNCDEYLWNKYRDDNRDDQLPREIYAKRTTIN